MKFYLILQILFVLSILINITLQLKPNLKGGDDGGEISDKELDELLKKPEYAKMLNEIPSKSEMEKQLKKSGKNNTTNESLVNLAATSVNKNLTSKSRGGKTGITKNVGGSTLGGMGTMSSSAKTKVKVKVKVKVKRKIPSYKQSKAYREHLERVQARNHQLQQQLK